MYRSLVALALIAIPVGAVAQADAPPQRIRNVQTARGEPCPKAGPNEVVVCDTLGDPYRIPKPLRDSAPIPTPRQSWVNRAADIDQTSRVAGGLPDTCSTVGTGGQTGCSLAAARAWAAERRAGNVAGR